MTNLQRDLFFGFDRIFDQISNPQQKQSYPPYNVVKFDDSCYVIEIAVAGFNEDDLSIKVIKDELTVTGSASKPNSDIDYVHKGISSRDFTRTFTLANTIEVEGAEVVNGVLQIGLRNAIPEEDQPREIKIIKQEPQLLTE